MHTYIRLLHESLLSFRALMTSARARLIDVSASEALSHSRLWARRSDQLPHHFHPWHRTEGFLYCYTFTSERYGLLRLRRSDRPPRYTAAPRRLVRSCWPRPRRSGSSHAAPSATGSIG